MARHLRSISGAPAPVGPYSTAVEANGFVFVSGQGGLDPATGTLADNVADQTRQTMENIKAILAEFGLDFSNVVRCGIFLTDMKEWTDMNQVYATYFAADPPARTTVGVAALPVKEMKVEIDAIAERV